MEMEGRSFLCALSNIGLYLLMGSAIWACMIFIGYSRPEACTCQYSLTIYEPQAKKRETRDKLLNKWTNN